MTWYKSISSKFQSIAQRDITSGNGWLHFKNLDWRLEATLASRSLNSKCDPKVTMRLTLEDKPEDKEVSVCLEADVKTLENLVNNLEDALNEANRPAVRKLMKKYAV